MAHSFKLQVLKRALNVLPDGPSNIKEFTESLRNPQGETIVRANIYQVCKGVLSLDWLETEIDAKIEEYQIRYPENYQAWLKYQDTEDSKRQLTHNQKSTTTA